MEIRSLLTTVRTELFPELSAPTTTYNSSLTGCLMIGIWLILPVVICLSQRLSHACLSISDCTVKLRMAH